MVKKSPRWLFLLISFVALAFVASGCAKKQIVKEGAMGKGAIEAKKEVPKAEAPKKAEQPAAPVPAKPPAAVQVPKQETKAAVKEEAVPKAAEKPFDLNGERIQFAFDDYALSTRARKNLNEIAGWMEKNPGMKIQIQGNTCDIGTPEYNLALGEERADGAKKYLAALGVDPGRLSEISFGEEKPLVANTDESHRSQNRRDEFVAVMVK